MTIPCSVPTAGVRSKAGNGSAAGGERAEARACGPERDGV